LKKEFQTKGPEIKRKLNGGGLKRRVRERGTRLGVGKGGASVGTILNKWAQQVACLRSDPLATKGSGEGHEGWGEHGEASRPIEGKGGSTNECGKVWSTSGWKGVTLIATTGREKC